MKQGAADYIMKNNLSRLPEAIKREIDESKIRIKLKETEEDIKNSLSYLLTASSF